MPRQFVLRGAVTLCMLVGVAALSIRKDAAAGYAPSHYDPSPHVQSKATDASLSNSATINGVSPGPHYFSMQYDYCYVDAKGRPMIFHRRRLVFFVPESPPEVLDRTFIETDSCRQ